MAIFDDFDDDLDAVADRARNPDAGIRRVAMLGLAESVDPGAVDLLLAGLKDADAGVREAAAKSLDEHSGLPAALGLIEALDDAEEAVRLAAAEPRRQEGTGLRPRLIERAQETGGAYSAFVRASALRALRDVRDPSAMPVALAALTDPDIAVRREALGVLGYLKADAALPALLLAATDPEPAVRRAVMAALVFVRSGTAGVPALIAGLKDGHWQVREEAAYSIGKAKIVEAVDPLMAAANDDAWQVKAKAVNALGKLKARAAVPVVSKRWPTSCPTCARRPRRRWARSPIRPRSPPSKRSMTTRTRTCASWCAGPSTAVAPPDGRGGRSGGDEVSTAGQGGHETEPARLYFSI